MGVDIDYYFDHDMGNLTPNEFLAELKRRTGKEIVLTGFDSTDENGVPTFSPYKNNKHPENGISICCYDKTFEEAFCNIERDELSLTVWEDGKAIGLDITILRNSIHISPDDEFSFIHSRRWNHFIDSVYDDFLANNLPENFEKMKKVLVPIFHCTQIFLCGDEVEIFSDSLWEGKTIEEAINIAKENNRRCQVVSFSDKADPYNSLDIIINDKWEIEFTPDGEVLDDFCLCDFRIEGNISVDELRVLNEFMDIENTLRMDSVLVISNPKIPNIYFASGSYDDFDEGESGYGMRQIIIEGIKNGLSLDEVAAVLYLIKKTVETAEISDEEIKEGVVKISKDGITVMLTNKWKQGNEAYIILGFPETSLDDELLGKEAADAIKAVIEQHSYVIERSSICTQVSVVFESYYLEITKIRKS